MYLNLNFIIFLQVNNQDKVQILPITLDYDIQSYDDESYVDMEFAYDKSLEYTCIYNIGILRVKNGTKKFTQLTIEKLNEGYKDNAYEIVFQTMGNTSFRDNIIHKFYF